MIFTGRTVLVGCEFSWTDLFSVLDFFETLDVDGPSLSDKFASTFLLEDFLLGGMSQKKKILRGELTRWRLRKEMSTYVLWLHYANVTLTWRRDKDGSSCHLNPMP